MRTQGSEPLCSIVIGLNAVHDGVLAMFFSDGAAVLLLGRKPQVNFHPSHLLPPVIPLPTCCPCRLPAGG